MSDSNSARNSTHTVSAHTVSASARTLEELSYAADASGLPDVSRMLMDMAVRAESNGGRLGIDNRILAHPQALQEFLRGGPNLAQARANASAGGSRSVFGASIGLKPDSSEGMTTLFSQIAQPGDLSIDSGLTKALAREQFRSRPTPYRINATLMALGVYDGVRDPAEASNRTFQFLRRMSNHPIAYAANNLRAGEVCRVARIARDHRETGLEVGLKEGKRAMTRAARKTKEYIEQVIEHGGMLSLPNGDLQRHPESDEPGVWDGAGEERALGLRERLLIDTFDLLSLDWSCNRIESGVNPDKYPITFFSPVDSAQIRLVEPLLYGAPRVNPALSRVMAAELSPFNVQEVIREYSWSDISILTQHPRMDWLGRGYGRANMEVAVELLAGMTSNFKFQDDVFSSAHLPYGYWQFQGMPSLQGRHFLNAVKQELLASGGGESFWDIICLLFPMGPNGQSGSAEFKPFRENVGGEMENAARFWHLLMTIYCSVINVAPEELGFEGATQKENVLQQEDPNTAIQQGKNKGRDDILAIHAFRYTRDIAQRIDPDFECRWINIEPDAQAKREDIAAKKMARGWSPNDIADLFDEPRQKVPLEQDIYDEIAARYSPDDERFDTEDEYREKVEKTYEKEMKKRGAKKAWSSFPNLPVLCPQALQIVQQEQAENAQAMAAAQGIAPGTSGMAPGGAPGAMAGQMPGQDGQTLSGTPQNSQMAQNPAAMGQNGGHLNGHPQAQGQSQQAQPQDDLQPHHLLSEYSQRNSASDDPHEADISDDERIDRFRRALRARAQAAGSAQATASTQQVA